MTEAIPNRIPGESRDPLGHPHQSKPISVIFRHPTKLLNGSRLSPGMRSFGEPSPTRRRVLAAARVLLLPRAAWAQTAGQRRIAWLSPTSRPTAGSPLAAFREGSRTLGYGDTDIAIEIRYADGQMERLPYLADQIRAGGQSENGEGARADASALDPRRRRRGHRMTPGHIGPTATASMPASSGISSVAPASGRAPSAIEKRKLLSILTL